MIELDDRAQEASKRALEVKSSNAEEGEPKPAERIEVARDDVRALRRLERGIPSIMAIVLRAAEEGGAAAVKEWVNYARTRLERPPMPAPRATSPPRVQHAAVFG